MKKIKCAQCDKSFPSDYNFCPHCGTPLAEDGAVEHLKEIEFPFSIGYNIGHIHGRPWIAGLGSCKDQNFRCPESFDCKAVQGIMHDAFNGKTNIKSIYIPASYKFIGNNAFYDCKNLRTIVFGGSKNQWKRIRKGKTWWAFADFVVVCKDGIIRY